MRDVIVNFKEQIKEALGLGKGITLPKVERIVVSGMGGSGFAGDVLKSLFSDKDILVNKDYGLPRFINENALVFIVSYSGNTEETLSSLEEALKRQCSVVVISSGGKCVEIAEKKKLPLVKVPSGIQPRSALAYLLIPMLTVLEENEIIKNLNVYEAMQEIDMKELEEGGKELAKHLYKHTPLIYSSENLKCLSYGWKTRLNENSKVHAFSNTIPEMNHNEIVGFTKKVGKFVAILIADRDDSRRNKLRFNITKELIRKHGVEYFLIETNGYTLLSRIFKNLLLADFTSYYLALEYDVKPEPIKIVEDLKKELM